VTEAVAADVGVPGVAVADEGSVSGAGSVGYDPAQLEVTPEMTVAGQLHDITSGDSPLMALARQQGLLSAGRRGLMNSSIAAQAAQAAVVNAALPIAQQDATTHLRAAEANQQSLNRALEFGASAENVAELQNSIEKNKMDALNAQLGTDVSKFNAEQLNEAETLAAQMKTAVSQQNADAYNKAQQQFADLQAKADMMALEQTFAASQQSTAATNKINQQVVQAITDLNKQYLAGTQAIDIAQINGQFSNLISQNEAAAKIYDAYFDGVSAIMSNKDIAPQKAAQYIQAQLKQLQGALTYIREMNQANLGSFTPTGGFTAPAPTAAAAPTA
jgi:S-adenosylmethionine/arginine decarboxylase-like enzyme